MTSVKGMADDPLVPELMAQLFARIMREGAAEGSLLRPSQMRVLTHLVDQDRPITDLAERAGMTKQGCGQFVRKLAALGLVTIAAAPTDRRVRLVALTPPGAERLRDSRRALRELERAWASEVGERRFATFRAVLHQLGDDPAD